MIAMRNPSLRARAKRTYSDYVELFKNDSYQRGLKHGAMLGAAVILSSVFSVLAGVAVVNHLAYSASVPDSQLGESNYLTEFYQPSQYYLLNDDGTIKAAVDDVPENDAYFQDYEFFNQEVALGYDEATYTAPDGVSHTINLAITGTMDRDARIQTYNRLVQSGSMEPITAGATIDSLTQQLFTALTEVEPNYGTGEVAPIITAAGEKFVTIGSDDLLQNFRQGVAPEVYDGNGEVAEYNFACEEIKLGFGNEEEYVNDLMKRYPDFGVLYATLDIASVMSNTAEPCGITYKPSHDPSELAPSVPTDFYEASGTVLNHS